MSTDVFLSAFRNRFPEFAETSDALINRYAEIATIFLEAEESPLLDGASFNLATQLLTAHCLTLFNQSNANNDNASMPLQNGVLTRATIDKVSVEYTPPTFNNGFDYWANITIYGQELISLIKIKAAGGFYFGGAHERCAFRKAGGTF